MKKTNVERQLESHQITYEVLHYEVIDGQIDGVSVAAKVGKPPERVYKTLVLVGQSKQHYVCIIPVEKNLSLKKAAKLFGEKKIEMIAVKDILKITGYIRGGCSPIGMKKPLKTLLDESAKGLSYIVVSAGKIGSQIVIDPNDLMKMIDGQYGLIVEDV